MTDRPAWRDGFGSSNDGVRVDAVVGVEILDRAGLPEMLDTERTHAMTGDRAKPAERCRMTIDHADNAAMARQRSE